MRNYNKRYIGYKHSPRQDERQEKTEDYKPQRNRVMCPDCGKVKMLFETQKKAENFIRWNGDKIYTFGGQLRAYYCPACCGWHVTHREKKDFYDNNTDRLLEAYQKSRKAARIKVTKEKSDTKEEETARMAEKIFSNLPIEIRQTYYKNRLKKGVTKYFKEHRIGENDKLRVSIYALWYKEPHCYA